MVQVESVDFVADAPHESVATGVMICETATQTGHASGVVETRLVVEFEEAVVLEVESFGPVVGEDLGGMNRLDFGESLHEQRAYNKVDIFSICVSLKLERQLVQVVQSHTWFVCASGQYVVTISSSFDFVASLGKLKVLY